MQVLQSWYQLHTPAQHQTFTQDCHTVLTWLKGTTHVTCTQDRSDSAAAMLACGVAHKYIGSHVDVLM